MSKAYNNFTLVIQGPLQKNGIYGILNNYSQYTDNIILSYWNTDKDEMKAYIPMLKEHLPNLITVENQFKIDITTFNNQNVYYQVLTSNNGISRSNTEFTVKLRCDQHFGNLIPFFESILKNPDKYNCSNLHFRPSKAFIFHPSDKLIGSRTDLMQETFKIALHRLKYDGILLVAGSYNYTTYPKLEELYKNIEIKNLIEHYDFGNKQRYLTTEYGEKPLVGTVQLLPNGYLGIVPETLIGTSFLLAKDIIPIMPKANQQMLNNFNIVKVEDMIPYTNRDGNDVVEHNWVEIDNINQVDK